MRSSFIIAAVLSCASATPTNLHPYDNWKPPGHGDGKPPPSFKLSQSNSSPVRGPCPGLNTLANYGLLPRDGMNIDLQSMISAFATFNGDPAFAQSLFEGALATNVFTPNATTFSLHDLRIHDHVEHDASLRYVYTSSHCTLCQHPRPIMDIGANMPPTSATPTPSPPRSTIKASPSGPPQLSPSKWQPTRAPPASPPPSPQTPHSTPPTSPTEASVNRRRTSRC